MRSKPTVIVTCDGPNGCTNQIEIFTELPLPGKMKAQEFAEAVDREIKANGWTIDDGRDLCDECGG